MQGQYRSSQELSRHSRGSSRLQDEALAVVALGEIKTLNLFG